MEKLDKSGKIWPFLLVAVALAGLGVFLFLTYHGAPASPRNGTQAAHSYKDPSIDISKIRMKVFYVVPKNKVQAVSPLWRETISSALDRAVRFHGLQFRGLSQISYDIFPAPIFLRNEDSFYDTTSTNAGNPRALIGVAKEVDERVLRVGGDLYDKEFAKFDKSEYPVMGLIYEGVGASGGVIYETELKTAKEIAEKLGVPESIIYIVDIGSVKGFFLLNSKFLTAPQYGEVSGPTLLYHEFAHTIGLPDLFDENDVPSSGDVMGGGRLEPIEATYIGRDLLKGLGVIPD